MLSEIVVLEPVFVLRFRLVWGDDELFEQILQTVHALVKFNNPRKSPSFSHSCGSDITS